MSSLIPSGSPPTSTPPQPEAQPPLLKIDIPLNINWSHSAAAAGLKAVEVSKAQALAAPEKAGFFKIDIDHNIYYYSKAEVLAIAKQLLTGAIARHYPTDEEKIKFCINCIIKQGGDIAQLRNAYHELKTVDRVKQKWAEAETNRLHWENYFPAATEILSKVPGYQSVKSNATRLFEKLADHRKALTRSDLEEPVRLAEIDSYLQDLTALCKIFAPAYKTPGFDSKMKRGAQIDQLLGAAGSIDRFLTLEKAAVKDLIACSEPLGKKQISQKVSIIQKYEFHASIDLMDIEINNLLQLVQKEKGEKFGNPGLVIFRAFDILSMRSVKIAEMKKNHLITPLEVRLLDVQGNFLAAKIKEAAAQLKLGRDLEGISRKLEEGSVRTKKWDSFRDRNPERVKAEIRNVVSTLLVQALVLDDHKAWEKVDKLMLNLQKIDKGKHWDAIFKDPNDVLRLGWESNRSKIKKSR